MDKADAIALMHQGKRISHDYFLPHEWITIKTDFIEFEDGVRVTEDVFWAERQSIGWEKGYFLWEPR